MKRWLLVFACVAALGSLLFPRKAKTEITSESKLRFAVSYPARTGQAALDGRLLLLISTNNEKEPRLQISEDLNTQQVFGVDVNGWKPETTAIVDASAFGYPRRNLADVPAGEYWVQALLHRYETFRRADGHTVKLPMDRGEGQQWSRAPGNLYSTPQKIKLDPGEGGNVEIKLDQVIPPIESPKDTKYIKHIRVQSERLTKFWGRPMHLGAHVLLPEGFDSHPEARYPLVIFHGHFPSDFGGFREAPPDPNLKPDYSERFHLAGYNRIQQEYAHQFYKDWIGPDFPRFVIVEIQHPTPYYDD